MPPNLPELHRKSSPFVFNVDWFDSVSGLGYKRFYPFASAYYDTGIPASANTYAISTEKIDSNPWRKGGTEAGAAYVAFSDIDFDVTFGKPAKIGGGDAHINITHYNNNGQTYLQLTLYHVRGVTETSLGSVQSDPRGVTNYYRESLIISVSEKQFAVGDILRLTVKHYGKNNAGNTQYFYCDPNSLQTYADGDGRTIGTDLIFDCPFVVET